MHPRILATAEVADQPGLLRRSRLKRVEALFHPHPACTADATALADGRERHARPLTRGEHAFTRHGALTATPFRPNHRRWFRERLD